MIGGVIAISASLVLFACGGGGGGSAGASGFQQTYTASATVGEILTFSVDTSAMTYSYTITKSAYGCDVSTSPCHSGSGTLTSNGDGTYSPSQSPSSKIVALQNGLLTGSIVLNLNNVNKTVPIVGVSNPITSVSALAGTYNFMSLQCTNKSYAVFTGCTTYNGTATVAANGTYSTCTGDNISANVHNCTNTTGGTLTSLGGGLWELQATTPAVGATTNYFLAFTAPNGQNVGVIDFNDSTVYGYGQAIMSTQTATVASALSGLYAWGNDYGQGGTVTLNANETTSSGLTIQENTPWTGIATVTGGTTGTGYGLIAGNGVYVYRNPNIPNEAAYFEIGLAVH